MPRQLLVFVVILLTLLGLLELRTQLGLTGVPLAEVWRAGLVTGPPLLEVRAPAELAWRPLGQVDVLVRFPDEARVRPETFRCLLNGVDVTAQLTVGSNGAGGSIFPLVVGRNTLRIEVFGEGYWDPSTYHQHRVELVLDARGPLTLDRA
jgi:hypothetical protein